MTCSTITAKYSENISSDIYITERTIMFMDALTDALLPNLSLGSGGGGGGNTDDYFRNYTNAKPNEATSPTLFSK